jgi:phenylpropionate dioxygenase-like ring-hydroxylating dioxygenase large terminal subunit
MASVRQEPFLRNLWYFAMPGTALRPGKLVAKTLLGEPLVFARGADGAPFALVDICPHRGIPLSYGRLDRGEVECCYHGWRFGADGRCTAIPSLVEGQGLDVARIKAKTYPCREVQGNIWIFMSDKAGDPATAPAIPELPGVGAEQIHITDSLRFPCYVDHAVVGLMDPAHGPFVHTSWWWRPSHSAHEKAKHFGPSPLGFTMLRHRPSSNSRAYKLLGGAPETEISFRLPGVRIEHIQAGRHVLCNLTAVTPINERETEVNHVIYWTLPWLTPLTPLLRRFARKFLEQDRDVVVMQQEGLKHKPNLMLIDDADRQAKWYYRLKREWSASQAERRPFDNPVTERTLRWRS